MRPVLLVPERATALDQLALLRSLALRAIFLFRSALPSLSYTLHKLPAKQSKGYTLHNRSLLKSPKDRPLFFCVKKSGEHLPLQAFRF